MKIKIALLAWVIIIFMSCEEKTQDSTINNDNKVTFILKNKYDKNTDQIRFKWGDREPIYSGPDIGWDGTLDWDGDINGDGSFDFDGDIGNDGTLDWGDIDGDGSFDFDGSRDWGDNVPSGPDIGWDGTLNWDGDIDGDGSFDFDGDIGNDGTLDWGDIDGDGSFDFDGSRDWGTDPPISSEEPPINTSDPWQTVEIGDTGIAGAWESIVNGITYQYDYNELGPGLEDSHWTKMVLESYFFNDVNQVGGVPANKVTIRPATNLKTEWVLHENDVYKYTGYDSPPVVYDHQVQDAGDNDYRHWTGTQRYNIKLTYRPDTTDARVFEYVFKGIGVLGEFTTVTVTGIRVYENGNLVREAGDNDVLGPIL